MERGIAGDRLKDKVQAVVLDWAGTVVDHGCMGPVQTFIKAFAKHGVTVGNDEARKPMGQEKRQHLREMFHMPEIARRWQTRYGHSPTLPEMDAVYATVEELMVQTLSEHMQLVPGVLESVGQLKSRDIKIGSCTGYPASVMAILVPEAARQGYTPEVVVSSSDVPASRPYPWMCYLAAIKLGVYPMKTMVKIGDTVADIQEGLNAGMWTIGIVRTGNYVGLTEAGLASLDTDVRNRALEKARKCLWAAGAHYVVDSIADIVPVVDAINERLEKGGTPS